jgi:peroxiredoxin family protein
MSPEGPAPGARPFWVLLLQRDSPDSLYEAAAMTAAAVSLGLDVTLIWFDSALESLVSGRLAQDDPDLGAAARLLAESRETGNLRSLACSASLVNRRLDRGALARCVDDLIGWPTAISLIRSAERSFVW